MIVGEITYGAAFLAGLVSFFSPCVLPLAPPYLCYLAGVSFDQMIKARALPNEIRQKSLWMAVIFVLGFTTVFVSLGASASGIGWLLTGYMDVISQIAGVFIVIMGLNIAGFITIPFLYRDLRYNGQAVADSYMSAYLMGLAFAFGWTPCIGPILGTILVIAANESTIYEGAYLLVVYSIGLGVPFILMAFAMKPFMNFTGRFRLYLGIMERITGLLLVVTGVAFMTKDMYRISFWILQYFPQLGSVG